MAALFGLLFLFIRAQEFRSRIGPQCETRSRPNRPFGSVPCISCIEESSVDIIPSIIGKTNMPIRLDSTIINVLSVDGATYFSGYALVLYLPTTSNSAVL